MNRSRYWERIRGALPLRGFVPEESLLVPRNIGRTQHARARNEHTWRHPARVGLLV